MTTPDEDWNPRHYLAHLRNWRCAFRCGKWPSMSIFSTMVSPLIFVCIYLATECGIAASLVGWIIVQGVMTFARMSRWSQQNTLSATERATLGLIVLKDFSYFSTERSRVWSPFVKVGFYVWQHLRHGRALKTPFIYTRYKKNNWDYDINNTN